MSSADSDFDGSLVETRQEPLGRWLSEIPVRSLLASYEVSTQELGRGGFGTVVVGRKRHLPQAVAIKRIHADLKFSASDQRRFVREVQLLAPLQHPNIVRVEDWGRDDAGLYLVMELIDGPNLATLVNQCGGPLSLTQLLDFTAQICRALQWAHQHGIVHRDLKPANLLLDRFGVIKLGDFGLARVDPNVREGLTSSGAVQAFTYAYASPEQLRGDSVVDGRSDLFSLGATLYHLATGRADTSRTFDLDALPASLAPLQPLLSGLLRPNLARRLPDVAAVLQVLDEISACVGAERSPAVLPVPLVVSNSAAPAAGVVLSERIQGSCWKCACVNSVERKFCADCGTALREPCLSGGCRTLIGVWEVFCPECGAEQPVLRQSLQQQTTQLCQAVQRQLAEQRFDFAGATLLTVQELLSTVRLQQLQPGISQLSAAIGKVEQSVRSVVLTAEQLGGEFRYSEALQSLAAIPQPLWPAAAVDWHSRQCELEQLSEQLPSLMQRGDAARLSETLDRLEHLQPGRWSREASMQQCVAVVVQRAIELLASDNLEAALQCLEEVPSPDRTVGCREQLAYLQQRVANLQQQAERLAGGGNYQQALDLVADLGKSRRPRGWTSWQAALRRVQKLREQLAEPALQIRWDDLMSWVGDLQKLQPKEAVQQRYVGHWLQEHESAAVALEHSGRWDEVVTLLLGVPEDERTPLMLELLEQIEKRVFEVCAAAAKLAAEGNYANAVRQLQQLPPGLRTPVLAEYKTKAEQLQKLPGQLDEAIKSEQLSLAVQCLETLESLQPGRWRQDVRPMLLLERLLLRCDQLLQLGSLGPAANLLQGIPASSRSKRYHVLQKKLQEQQQQAEQALRQPDFPFSATAAGTAQSSWAKYLGRSEEWTNKLGMKFRIIPAGCFLMGSPDRQGNDNERPQHKVTIAKSFGLGVYTVTQRQWLKLMGDKPWKGQSLKVGLEIAATCVSWDEAVSFCRNLSDAEGVRYRLPTEAEWEWSCRAGTTTAYSFGDDVEKLNTYAWFHGEREGSYPHAVGQKLANAFGLCDMHGNVWEWCQDWYDECYYEISNEKDPAGSSAGSSRVLRGGSWRSDSATLRSAHRINCTPGSRYDDFGFRVVCELE